MKLMMPSYLISLSMLLLSNLGLANLVPVESDLSLSFDANRSSRYISAKTFYAYGDSSLTISLQPQMPTCRQGMACIQLMPSPVSYELPVVSSVTNACGVVTTKALDDRRPVDGPLTSVKIVDNSKNSCNPSLVNVVRLEFSTEIFSRGMRKPVRTLDKFLSAPSQAVYGADLEADSNERYESASVTVDGRTATIDLSLTQVQPLCPKGQDCQSIEPTVDYKLENARIRTNSCGVVQTIAGFDDTPVDGIEFRVTINNNMGNSCPTFAPLSAIEVVVEQRYYSRLEREVQTIDFFRSENIRFIKPTN